MAKRINKIVLQRTPQGSYYFILKSGNGQINLTSATVGNLEEIERIIARAKELVRDPQNIRILKTPENEPYFIISENDEMYARSGKYTSLAALNDGIRHVRRNIENSVVVDLMAETD